MQHRAVHNVLPNRGSRAPRLASALTSALVACASLMLSGCTPTSPTVDRFDAWYEQMQTVLSDPNGIGGGGAPTPGSVELDSMRAGRWVTFAVCHNVDRIHLRIRGGNKTLAETDVPCGATIAMPITVDSAAASHFEILTTRAKGTAGSGWWSVQINSTSWKQTESFSFN